MYKTIAATALVASLAACNQATAPSIESEIASACSIAVSLAPFAPTIAPWITGGCSTAEAISKLAQDPSSLAWINQLIGLARAARVG